MISPICAKNVEPYLSSFSDSEKNEGKSYLDSSQNPFSLTAITGASYAPDPVLVVGYIQLIAATRELFPR